MMHEEDGRKSPPRSLIPIFHFNHTIFLLSVAINAVVDPVSSSAVINPGMRTTLPPSPPELDQYGRVPAVPSEDSLVSRIHL